MVWTVVQSVRSGGAATCGSSVDARVEAEEVETVWKLVAPVAGRSPRWRLGGKAGQVSRWRVQLEAGRVLRQGQGPQLGDEAGRVLGWRQ